MLLLNTFCTVDVFHIEDLLRFLEEKFKTVNSFHNKVGCRYNEVQYNMLLHTSLQQGSTLAHAWVLRALKFYCLVRELLNSHARPGRCLFSDHETVCCSNPMHINARHYSFQHVQLNWTTQDIFTKYSSPTVWKCCPNSTSEMNWHFPEYRPLDCQCKTVRGNVICDFVGHGKILSGHITFCNYLLDGHVSSGA